MKSIQALLIASLLVVSDAHAQRDLAEVRKADLTGVWSTGKVYTWFYEDHTMMTMDLNCFLQGIGTWRFEYGMLTIYVDQKEVFFRNILDVPVKPKMGDKMVLDTMAEWMFMGGDTDQEC